MKNLVILKKEGIVNEVDEIICKGDFEKMELIGKGATSNMYKYKDCAVKVFKPTKRDTNDIEILLNKDSKGRCPELYGYRENVYLVREFIYGELVFNLEEKINNNEPLNKKEKDFVKTFYKDLYQFCLSSVEKGLIPSDVHSQNIIRTNNNDWKIVDVGDFFIDLDEDMYVKQHYGLTVSNLLYDEFSVFLEKEEY